MGSIRNFLHTHTRLFLSLSFLVLFSVTVSYATPPASPYAAGTTLNPQCAPGESNCTVNAQSFLSGAAGGQTFAGGMQAGDNLILTSTSNTTKGKILFGTSAYDEVTNRLGVGTNTPTVSLDVVGSAQVSNAVSAKVVTAADTVGVGTSGYQVADTSPNVSAHQGYAWDGTYHYVINTNRIDKYDTNWNLVAQNTTPFAGISGGVNHIGDGDIYNGVLYVPVEYLDPASPTFCDSSSHKVVRFSTADLSFVSQADSTNLGVEAGALTIDADDNSYYLGSFCDGTKYFKYDLTNDTYKGTVSYDGSVSKTQGLELAGTTLYISTAQGIYTVNKDGSNLKLVYYVGQTGGSSEGLDVVNGQIRLLYDLDNGGLNSRVLFLNPTNSSVFNADITGVNINNASDTSAILRASGYGWTKLALEDKFYSPKAYFGGDGNAVFYTMNARYGANNLGAWSKTDDTLSAFALGFSSVNNRIEFRVHPPGAYAAWNIPFYINATGDTNIKPLFTQTSNNQAFYGLDLNASLTAGSYTGGTVYDIRTANGIVPASNNTVTLGTSALAFSNIFSNTIDITKNSNNVASAYPIMTLTDQYGSGTASAGIKFIRSNPASGDYAIGNYQGRFIVEFGVDIGPASFGGSTRSFTIDNGHVGIYDVTAPTARLHIAAGSATAGTAPLKFNSGTNLATPEAGTMEFNGTSLFFTPSTVRYNFMLNNMGLSGGQTVVGDTAASGTLTLSSTSNVTKGKILFGTSAYDEASNRLGVGTATPGAKLQINADSVYSTPGNEAIIIANATTPAKQIRIGYDSGIDAGYVQSAQTSVGYKSLSLNPNGGFVGIGNTGPGYLLHVGSATPVGIVARFQNSTGTCDINPTATALSCSSDMTLKKNIETISDGNAWSYDSNIALQNRSTLALLLALKPVRYNWNSEMDTDAKHAGFIAQDVRQLFPDLVTEDSATHLLSLNYMGMIPYTVQAIQEMNLNITDISNLDRDNTWRNALVAWLGSATNGIQNIFSKKVTTDELSAQKICIGETNNQVCITKDQLQQMIQNNSGQTSSPTPAPIVEQEPETQSPEVSAPEVETETPPAEEPVAETEEAPE